ncbi:VapE domain-containing protein [Deefgea piscis]|uniref:VapE domain-containing protein n=1 Tax=Deefgea piscis TaxID=2739061 RepID=UPI001C81EA29|nr:VapE domain-containing protein [Deefgea piscis]QZA80197.1 hypothetical protein K4H25_11705 [Deefgea piscis]
MGNREFEKVDFKAVSRATLDAAERLLAEWLPLGRRVNGEWVCPNPMRKDSNAGSFSISINKGVWKDFATNDGGADLISLYCYLNGCSPLDGARELHSRLGVPFAQDGISPAPSASPVKGENDDPWVNVFPVPDDAPEPHVAHIKRGRPDAVRCYKDAQNNVLGYIYRFRTSDGGKEDIPHTLWRHKTSGALEWKWKQWPEPRPLYGLNDLAAKPDAPVLVVEGEKCRDVAALHLSEFAVVSWPGGCNGVGKVDFSPLAGRELIQWPDADAQRVKLSAEEKKADVDPESKPLLELALQPGSVAMAKVAAAVCAIEPNTKVMVAQLPVPGTYVGGWDIADAIELDGWSADQCRAFIANGISTPKSAGAGQKINPEPAQAQSKGGVASDDWSESLLWSETGLRPVFSNAYEILKNDPAWVGVLAFNEFSGAVHKLKPPPWQGAEAGLWADSDSSKALIWLQQQHRLFLKASSIVDEAAQTVAYDNRFHPVRSYLSDLVWDGVERLPFWLADVFAAEQSDFNAYVGCGWLVSAVARIFEPGCKVDEMVVLEGGQGAGKSTAVNLLCGSEWYLESSENPSGKDFYITLQGRWIVEIGEMNSFSKADLNQVKMAVTRRDDTFRAPYDKRASSHPRQCVFVGTTNAGQYLSDPTGGRRFLPVRCGDVVNLECIMHNRSQMWAEAVAKYRAGFKWWDFPKDAARDLQDARYIEDNWIEYILDYIDGRAPSNNYPDGHTGVVYEITNGDLMRRALNIPVEKHTRQDQMRVAGILKRLGWADPKQKSDGKRYYRRPVTDLPPAQAIPSVDVPNDF